MAGSCSNPGCTAQGTKRCARCKEASYCSTLCQKENWPTHKHSCKSLTTDSSSDGIKCVMLPQYKEVTVQPGDDIFNTGAAPITQKFGFPLLLRRTEANKNDNIHATWLMISPDNGIAPPEWQSGVGDCLVARADKKPLDYSTLAAITDYVSDIMNAFSDEPDRSVIQREFYNRKMLDKFIRRHLEMQQDYKAMQSNPDSFT